MFFKFTFTLRVIIVVEKKKRFFMFEEFITSKYQLSESSLSGVEGGVATAINPVYEKIKYSCWNCS